MQFTEKGERLVMKSKKILSRFLPNKFPKVMYFGNRKFAFVFVFFSGVYNKENTTPFWGHLEGYDSEKGMEKKLGNCTRIEKGKS